MKHNPSLREQYLQSGSRYRQRYAVPRRNGKRFNMMPPPEHESDRVSRAIELYHFGKEVTEDVRAVISDDLLVEVQAGSDRIAYPYGNSAFGGSWWEDTKYKKISGALVFYRTSGLLFTTEHRYEMSAQILYTYAVNGMSVKLEAVRPLNFQDLPGWSLEVSIWTRQITPIEHVYGLPVARLHITTEFAWYGLWTDTPDALLQIYHASRGWNIEVRREQMVKNVFLADQAVVLPETASHVSFFTFVWLGSRKRTNFPKDFPDKG